MYENVKSKVCIGSNYCSEFNVKVIHQYIKVLYRAPYCLQLSWRLYLWSYHIGCLWDLFYADDLVIAAVSLELLKIHF